MSSNDYTPVVRGSLKLKGGTPIGICKKKKKKKKRIDEVGAQGDSVGSSAKSDGALDAVSTSTEEKISDIKKIKPIQVTTVDEDDDTKTPSERAYEEMRRRRLYDRLAKEGLKSHKQRVEELNKYLSNLSEHHDMPRIGPG